MSRMRSGLIGFLALSALLVLSPATRGADDQAAKLWGDFIHYLRVAQLQLAASSGEALLAQNVPAEDLLAIIEASPYRNDYEKDLVRAHNIQAGDEAQAKRLAEVAAKVQAAITTAHTQVIRDPKRIRQAIQRLDDGQRANLNATSLLTEAGEYAAPQMVDVLLSRSAEDKALVPYVLDALVDIGRPMVAPLCQSMMQLPPIAQQQVARTLGQIGYPMALPYLKSVMETTDTAEEVKAAVQRSYTDIAKRSGVAQEIPAADLFLRLAVDYYKGAESLILEPQAPTNLVWMAENEGRLKYLRIPTPVFNDVQAMQASRRALALNPDLSPALSLWIAANFRRENNLPAGAADPSYGPDMRSPMYYASLAGPRHLHPVLEQAMADRDVPLTLDAIRALSATAGTQSILSNETGNQTLLAALNYPDRRVRFEAAFAIAGAMPTTPFTGSGRVLPVLASALRQSGKLYAVVIADDLEQANARAQQVRRAGNYEVLLGSSLATINDQVVNIAEVDVVVVALPAAEVDRTYADIRRNYKMQGAPVLLLVEGGDLVAVNRRYIDEPRATVSSATLSEAELASALNQALGSLGDERAMTDEQANAYALEAVGLMRDLAVAGNPVFDVSLTRAALADALTDPRSDVAIGASQVLAMLPGARAQEALAAGAMNVTRGNTVRVAILESLAASAKRHGARLSAEQTEKLLELVKTAKGPLADAAAQAHGALNLPTANAVRTIVE